MSETEFMRRTTSPAGHFQLGKEQTERTATVCQNKVT